MMFIGNIIGVLVAICCSYGLYFSYNNTGDVALWFSKQTVCEVQDYRTQIVSEDYVDNFVSQTEVSQLLNIG
jgi:hypothetical protein